ncbi:uncharacterized protein DUF1152 [Streptomyces sp. Ag109_O5-1]|uniref:DUF6829 domain-containing protein n=1 Tax=Streptomyces sp. Ag109_O5-1 TaxID=1938851 RepID=UPI000F4D5D29|nr:DUF1152 domain-containing protein [Streptomyces sp. Ag109_O5-1]RPE39109.1 uncharacterized protein DUF1152 [Streptomyces sp. Ag109_O5-1]
MAGGAFAPLSALPEFALLTEPGVSVSPEVTGAAHAVRRAEARRTALSDACLLEAWRGRRRRLAHLAPADFLELHHLVRAVLPDRAALRTARYFVAVHDAGKNPRLARAVSAGPGADHDAVLATILGDERYEAARRALLPTFDGLAPEGRRLIREACRWQLGYTKLLQGEVPAGHFVAIEQHLGPAARDLDIVKSIVDVAGAGGHNDESVSTTLTSAAWARMRALNRTLRDRGAGDPADRFTAYLDGEIARLTAADRTSVPDDTAERRALARLALHLRILDGPSFARLAAEFRAQPRAVRVILIEELARDGIAGRATLPAYGPALLRRLCAIRSVDFALTFFAHVLQEARIASAGMDGIVVADLESLVRADPPHLGEVRFDLHGEMLRPRPLIPPAERRFPPAGTVFPLAGRTGIVVGMGGGSDGVQAAMLRLILKGRFKLRDAVVVSVRRAENRVRDASRCVGTATVEVGTGTRPVGSWRFLEDVPLQSPDPARMFLLNSLDPATIRDDLTTIAAEVGATVIIGVDTGGDSLYRDTAGVDPVDASPSQDHRVLAALAALSDARPGWTVLSAIVAPGVDSPADAAAVLTDAGARLVELREPDARAVRKQYAAWRMDGSDARRFGKTPLAWLAALDGRTGLHCLDIPAAYVLAEENPWRCFLDVRPAMRHILVMEARRHAVAVRLAW